MKFAIAAVVVAVISGFVTKITRAERGKAGEWVVFTAFFEAPYHDCCDHSFIAKANLRTGRTQRLTSADEFASAESPAWSPDGRKIAYDNDDPSGIYEVAQDGRNRELITRVDGAPRWSPDGTRIAFADSAGIEVVAVRTGATRTVGGSSNAADVDWAPDGATFAFVGSHGVYTIPLSGGLPKLLFRCRFHCESTRWSPDGKRLLFERYRSSSSSFLILDVHTRTATAVPYSNTRSSATWSPNGQQILFDGHGGFGLYDLRNHRWTRIKLHAWHRAFCTDVDWTGYRR